MLKHLAIDLGNTNTLIATCDQEGTESLLHLPRIAQLDTQLSKSPERPYTFVPSEVFHSDDGPEVGARAWAKLAEESDYNGDPARLCDLARCTVCFNCPYTMVAYCLYPGHFFFRMRV